MRGFEDIGSKGDFSAKKGGFWAKIPPGGQTKFFSKICLEHFFSLAKMQLCAKFQKNLMRGSPDIASQPHGRTHARTDERESIGPSVNAEKPITKINKKSSTVLKKMAKNSPKPYNASNVF